MTNANTLEYSTQDLDLLSDVVMADTPVDTHIPMISTEDLLGHILNSLEEDKAEEILTIDLRGKSGLADYMVIASGRSGRQITGIAEKMAMRLKDLGEPPRSVEGASVGDWVLVDARDVIVHLFHPETRQHYALEKMWSTTPSATAPKIPLS